MVEFLLVATFLVLLFVGILQMILFMYAYNTLANAAKEGVRYAVVHGTGNSNCSGPGSSSVTCPDNAGNGYKNVKTVVVNFASVSFQNIELSEVNVDYNPNGANGSSACNVAGCLVQVTVAHTYTPFFGLSWPTVTMNAAAEGRIVN